MVSAAFSSSPGPSRLLSLSHLPSAWSQRPQVEMYLSLSRGEPSPILPGVMELLSHPPSPTGLDELCNRTKETVGRQRRLPHSSCVPIVEGGAHLCPEHQSFLSQEV